MDKLLLFTDGSVNTQVKVGYGAYLVVFEHEISLDGLDKRVKVKRFNDTSSTKLELQTLIWALDQLQGSTRKVIVYTDSQNIIGLLGRQNSLEQNNFRSGKNKLLNNHKLYREFYKIMDQLDCELVKVEGHLSSMQKSDIDRLFAFVDRGARKALKERTR